ncbi:MAG: hypothetical protein BWZ10_03362 [candidate division BRC1 bacterium ADurb.BinA364]|nr:MAG: hypothetical protein BWZ10_03362 [candidate division BRC1 bacterium ADurb.BinA364]
MGHAERGDLVKGLFQRFEASYAQDGVEGLVEQQFDDHRRAFGGGGSIAHRLGFGLQGAQVARSAFGAVEFFGRIAPGAAFGVAHAVGEQQDAPLGGDGGELASPEGVADRHHGETEEAGAGAGGFEEAACAGFEFFAR